MSEINTIICPVCRKRLLSLNRNGGYWKCPDCIYSYPWNWFEQFHQFDHLINVPLSVEMVVGRDKGNNDYNMKTGEKNDK